MMTRQLELQDWVKIDQTYASQQREKERLSETKKDKVFVTNTDASTVLAKQEFLELLCEYLPSNVVCLFCNYLFFLWLWSRAS